MKLKSIVTILLAALVLASVSLQAGPVKYEVTFLMGLGKDSSAIDLNNLGEVVGVYAISQQVTQPFLYSNGTFTALGTLGGPFGAATSINDYSQIAGWSYTTQNGFPHAFLYSDGKMTDLGTLGGQKGDSYANAVNNAGQIVGSSTQNTSTPYVVIFTQNGIIDIGSAFNPQGGNIPTDINDNYSSNDFGQIVGINTYVNGTSGSYYQAFLYSNNVMVNIGHTICSDLYENSIASSINNLGQIVGYCSSSDTIGSAFLYDSINKNHYFIGNIEGSQAYDINDAGQAIGVNLYPNGTLQYPFLFVNGEEYNLYGLLPPDSGLDMLIPVAINNKGQIVVNLNQGVALLTPINEDSEESF